MAKWTEPQYSREKVKQAGISILKAPTDGDEFKEASVIFFNWRAAHAFPMQIILDLTRKTAIRIDKEAVAVQRLKRVRSIFMKLINEKNMSYSRMEDIGGCRVVLSNPAYVLRVSAALKKSRTKHILHRDRDYISNPKESGYRGIHLVYKYNGRKTEFHGLPVEVQIRSKIQHSWATALEVVATFTGQALKASKGDADWLDFFRYASVEFSKIEGFPPDPRYSAIDTNAELLRLTKKLDVFKRLSTFNIAVNEIGDGLKDESAYFILLLDITQNTVQVEKFSKVDIENATNLYNTLEQEHRTDESKDVVMVSAKSLADLKSAYPNYFSDTDEFTKNLGLIT